MKKITTIIITLLLLTSCGKKKCETAQGRVEDKVHTYQTVEMIYISNPTQQNLNNLKMAKQEVEQSTIAMERQCK